jgi:DNA-binding MarR family transcriptional regulator
MGLIDDLGELAVGTRLMRLSERTRKDVTRIYKEHHLDFEAKWFPVLYVLNHKLAMGVVELADEIGYTHQSVMALVKEMQKQKLIKSNSSKSDGRKRMLSLTPKALDLIKEFKPLWEDFLTVNHVIYNNGSSLLKAVEDTEAALRKEGFYERYKKLEAKRKNKSQMT